MSQGSDTEPKAELSPLHAARVLAALEAARSASGRVTTEQRSASAALRRQQAALEAVQEAGQKVSERGRDVRNSLHLLRDSVERAKLCALNAGLEGARLGDPLGKALVVMGDEVRHLLARAVDALDEHMTLLTEIERDRDRAQQDLMRINDSTRQTGSALARSEEQSHLTTALLAELRVDLGDFFGTDAETARVLAETAGQVKNMANSLQGLAQRSPLAARELHELLGPLLALVPREEDSGK